MKEIWKHIKDYPNYEVSNLGNIKNLKSNKILTLKKRGNYLGIVLSKNNNPKMHSIHKIVAETFLNKQNFKCMPNENKKLIDLNTLEVNHKDENSYNNCVNNLEWCTHTYNINYGTRTEKAANKQCISILQYDLNNNFIKEWKRMNDAIRYYNNYHISDCCNNKRKTASGYIWKFKFDIKK